MVGLALKSGGDVELRLSGPNGPEVCRARAIVLCAGTVENARIVSQISEETRSFPIVDHHVQGWLCAVERHLFGGDSHDASVLVAHDHSDRINVFTEIHHIGERDVIDTWSMGEQIPTIKTQLIFDDGPDDIRFDVKLTREDDAVLSAQALFLAAVADSMELKLETPISPYRTLGFNEALKRAMARPGVAVPYHCPLGNTDHESCTLPLGGHIVGSDTKLRNIPSVFVTGPCLFPRAGAANPSLTTLALSKYSARQIVAELG